MKGYIIIYDESHMKQPEIIDISEVISIKFAVDEAVLGEKWKNGMVITKADSTEFGFLGIQEIRITIVLKHGHKEGEG